MAIKIYTKTGDKGQTSLIGGTRVPKHHIRIEAYGTIDELNSFIGLVRDNISEKELYDLLIEIQDRLFTIGSLLAADPEKNLPTSKSGKMQLPQISENDITLLEKAIDKMNESLPEMKHFILPGGNTIVSYCHIARCVCRRGERAVLKLAENEKVDELIYKYLNRLSDYLFVLCRKLSKDLNTNEIPWKPRL